MDIAKLKNDKGYVSRICESSRKQITIAMNPTDILSKKVQYVIAEILASKHKVILQKRL